METVAGVVLVHESKLKAGGRGGDGVVLGAAAGGGLHCKTEGCNITKPRAETTDGRSLGYWTPAQAIRLLAGDRSIA